MLNDLRVFEKCCRSFKKVILIFARVLLAGVPTNVSCQLFVASLSSINTENMVITQYMKQMYCILVLPN